MSKLKGYVVLTILAISWITLYWLTGSRTPWTIFSQAQDGKGIVVHLGDIPVENYDKMGFTKAVIRHIPKEDAWFVGTDKGEVFLINNEGRQLWKRNMGVGRFGTVAINREGTRGYIGESSGEGNLYCFNLHTGDVIWKQSAKQYIGADPAARSLPAIVHVACDENENVFATTFRFNINNRGKRSYCSRVLAFDKQGKELWKYPAEENMDSWVNWCDSGKDRIVVATSAYELSDDMKYRDTVYLLDKQSGKLIRSFFLETIPPYNNTVMRGSPNFSADGEYFAAACSDGRGFLFNKAGEQQFMRMVSPPTQVDGTWLNSTVRDAWVVKQGVIFGTQLTYNRENWQLPTPIEHPGNNSIFLFGMNGSFKYQYRANGNIEDLAFTATDKLAGAVGRNTRTHNYKAHGVFLMDLNTGKEEEFYSTEGPVQALSVTSDGSYIGAVEAPAMTPEGKILGAYRLHIWKTGGNK